MAAQLKVKWNGVVMAQLDSPNKTLERQIREEVREWSSIVLETPRSDMDGLTTCPYAKAAWDSNKVLMTFKRDASYAPIYESLEQFNDDFSINIVIDLDYEDTAEEFHERIDSLNYGISNGTFGDTDLWVMGSHPDDGEYETVDATDFEQTNDCSYAMIYIQRLKDLQKAVHKLKATKYYSFVFNDDEPSHVFKLREQFYKQLIGELDEREAYK